jgi:hypothetical protein
MKKMRRKIFSRFENRRLARQCRKSLPSFIGMMAHSLVYCSAVVRVYGRYVVESNGREWPEAQVVVPALSRAMAGLKEVERWSKYERAPEAEESVVRSAHGMFRDDVTILRSFCDRATGMFERVGYKGVIMTAEEKEVILGPGEEFPVGC